MNLIGVETATGWVLAILAAAVGVGFVATGMMEDLFDIVRRWRPSDNGRSSRGDRQTTIRR